MVVLLALYVHNGGYMVVVVGIWQKWWVYGNSGGYMAIVVTVYDPNGGLICS